MNEETMPICKPTDQIVREALETQIELLSERSRRTDDLGDLLFISKEIRNLSILLTGVRRLDLLRMGYDDSSREYRP